MFSECLAMFASEAPIEIFRNDLNTSLCSKAKVSPTQAQKTSLKY